jgi:predicted dehydrogenase
MNSEDRLRWGILSTGRIAKRFADGLTDSKTGSVAAVGSRHQGTADKFVADFPQARPHGSYEDLLADPQVDIVYIATPHPMHLEWAIKAAEAKKHILCEKPIGMNRGEAVRIVEAARKHDVFLMEAFSYRSHDQTAKLLKLIREGAIGEVKLIRAGHGFAHPFEPTHRLYDKKLGGGAILDIGCYPVSMVRLLAGAAAGKEFAEPLVVEGSAHLGRSGVDEWSVVTLSFEGDLYAQVSASVTFPTDVTLIVSGTEGVIKAPAPWIWPVDGPPCSIRLEKRGQDPIQFDFDGQDRVMAIQADRVVEFLKAKQSPLMSWEDSISNMETLDRWRAEIGLVYDSDGAIDTSDPHNSK